MIVRLWRSLAARTLAKAKADRKLIRAKAREMRAAMGMKPHRGLRG